LITIINLKIGNVGSVVRAVEKLNFRCHVTNDPKVINKSDKIILTGVGSFHEATNRLHSFGIYDVIRKKVLNENTPILGICLGMQLLAYEGMEGGKSKGLGLIKARVKYLRRDSMNLKLPHVGWNNVNFKEMTLFNTINNNSYFYFVHSYELLLEQDIPHAICHYGVDFIAAIQKDNIMGVQFHPEKSQVAGLCLINNFLTGVS
jgi:imidazole glycerol-phosphate synthase subunit HisH